MVAKSCLAKPSLSITLATSLAIWAFLVHAQHANTSGSLMLLVLSTTILHYNHSPRLQQFTQMPR
jgi:hypothetical protein